MIRRSGEDGLHGISRARLLNRGGVLTHMADILVEIGCIRAFKMLAATHISRLIALSRALVVVFQLLLTLPLTTNVLSSVLLLRLLYAQVVLVHRVYLLKTGERVIADLLRCAV